MSYRSDNPDISKFISALGRLDAGEKAQLKRNGGCSMSEAIPSVIGLFFDLLPQEVPEKQQEMYFWVATLYPLVGQGGAENFGGTFRKVRTDANRAGLDRRFRALLDADEVELPFRLHQTVLLMRSCDPSRNLPIHWHRLLQDLLDWHRDDHRAQKEWARAYFSQ